MTYQDIQDLQMLLDRDIRGVVAKGDISPKDYQCLDVAIDISKDLCEIAEKTQQMEGILGNDFGGDYGNSYGNSYAQGGNSNAQGGNSGMMPYNSWGNNSYARGRFGGRGGNSNARGGNSGNMEMHEKLNMMMQNASSEQERQIIQKIMNEMG